MRRLNLIKYLFITLMLSAITSCSSIKQEPVTLYVYHDFSPFWTETGSYSLSDLLVDSLDQSQDMHYIVKPISRSALNQLIEKGEPVRVVWANEKWFPNDKPLVSKPILWDSDVLIAPTATKIADSNIETLRGNRFCGTSGHYYRHLEPLLSTGELSRADANSNQHCIELLKQGKIDFMQMERSSVYNKQFAHDLDLIKVVEPSVDTFTRHILFFNIKASEFASLNEGIDQLKNQQLWQDGLSSFGNEKFIDLFDMDMQQLQQLIIY